MSESRFTFRECLNPACRFRYPTTETDADNGRCPACGGETRVVAERVHRQESGYPPDSQSSRSDIPMFGLLDNVRSVFNVGSIFRSADGVGLQHLYLTGMTPTPEHPKFGKTALGAEKRVSWSRSLNGVERAAQLRDAGIRLWALEDEPGAESLFDCRLSVDVLRAEPVALVVGNEVAGVDPGILGFCDRVIAIPMWGAKQSLNVAIAFGIAVYWLRGTGAR